MAFNRTIVSNDFGEIGVCILNPCSSVTLFIRKSPDVLSGLKNIID